MRLQIFPGRGAWFDRFGSVKLSGGGGGALVREVPFSVCFCWGARALVQQVCFAIPWKHFPGRKLEASKGHTYKGHRENILQVVNLRVFWGGYFQDVFRVFFPMPFLDVPFGPFHCSKLKEEHEKRTVYEMSAH